MTNNTPTSTQEHLETETLRPATQQAPNQNLPEPDGRVPSFIILLKKCFSFPAFLGAILVAANFGIDRALRLDPDTWWHLKYGDMILETGRWPTVDSWSFTVHGMPRVAYEWGGEVLIAFAYKLGGARGMDVLLITLTSVLTLLVYYFAWLRCRNAYAAFFSTFALLPLAALFFTLRPQLMGYIFLVITLIWLERFRQDEQKTLWVLPLIFLLWVNTHGSFALGFMVLGLYWLSGLVDFSSGGLYAIRWRPEQRLHMEVVGLLSIAVLPLTPYGTKLAAVPLNIATSLPLNFADIVEWQPLTTDFWQAKLLLVLLAGFVVAQVTLQLRFRLEEMGLFLLVVYLSFVHMRFAILFAIVFAPLAASVFVRWAPVYNSKLDKYAVNATLMFAFVVAMVLFLPRRTTLQKNIARDFPVQAVRYLREHPVPGRMFNDYKFGGYLVWALAPKNKVFIDGRGDIYEEAWVFSDYSDIVGLKPDAIALLQSYGINLCLVSPNGALATLLTASTGWKEIYKDTLSAIFVRQETTPSRPGLNAAREGQNRRFSEA